MRNRNTHLHRTMTVLTPCGLTIRAWLLIALLSCVSATALADPIDDCNSDSAAPSVVKTGCTAVIEQKLLAGLDLALAYSKRAHLLDDSQDLRHAIDDLKQAVSLVPADAEFHAQLVSAYQAAGAQLRNKGDLSGALSIYRDALGVEPKDSALLVGFAETAIASNLTDEAVAKIVEAAGERPVVDGVRQALAAAFEAKGRVALVADKPSEAEATLSKAIDLDQTHPSAYKLRAQALSVQGKSAAAIEDIDLYIRLAPAGADGFLLRAQEHRKLNRTAEAEADCDAALRVDPKNFDALLLRGLLQEEGKKLDAALADYEAAIAVDPTNDLAKKNAERMRGQIEVAKTAKLALDENMRTRLTQFAALYIDLGVVGKSDLSSLFADSVNYGGTVVRRSEVENDKRRYFARWFSRHYAMHPDSLALSRAPDGHSYLASFDLDFSVAKADVEVTGTARTQLTLIDSKGSFLITAEDDRVLDRTETKYENDESTNSNDGEEVGGGYWENYGSQLQLVANGSSRQFVFTKVGSELSSQGAKEGAVLFDGWRRGRHFSGAAYLFSKKCGKLGFFVEGDLTSNGLPLAGHMPSRDAKCNQVKLIDVVFTFTAVPYE
jgi:tetratricopeptide (TPR) repeat protein